MQQSRWLVLGVVLGVFLVAPRPAAADSGWRVIWADWCSLSSLGSGSASGLAGRGATPGPIACFNAMRSGAGHEIVFQAAARSWSAPAGFGSTSAPRAPASSAEVKGCLLGCTPDPDVIFAGALHFGASPGARPNPDWTALIDHFRRMFDRSRGPNAPDCARARGGSNCSESPTTPELPHQTTPEPVSMALLGTGLAGLWGVRRRTSAS